MPEKKQIVILGGGVGAMAAAYYLAHPKNPASKSYEITVYQMGWRLGGKGASGRRTFGDGSRIEEHGVHVWFGFYYNAIPMMRECYAELAKLPGAAADWSDVFTPHDTTVLEEPVGDGWRHVPLTFPPNIAADLPTPRDYLATILERLRDHYAEQDWFEDEKSIAGALEELLRFTLLPIGHKTIRRLFDDALDKVLELSDRPGLDLATVALATLLAGLRASLGAVLKPLRGRDEVRTAWMFIDLGLTIGIGMLRDDVLANGFDAIDEYDVWEWLAKHGADDDHAQSAIVRGLYAQGFAFVDGDPTQRQFAAGTAIRTTLRMVFAYGDQFMWKMNAGMGDIVFTPFYRVLKAWGVKFEFFHRVQELRLSPDRRRVAEVVLARQMRLAPGRDEYDPLVPVEDPRFGTRQCWPSEPKFDQLDPGQVAAFTALKDDPDAHASLESYWSSWHGPGMEEEVVLPIGPADEVVLGIALGALAGICPQLIAASERWADMVREVKTVRTQAFQLWFNGDVAGLGWPLGAGAVCTAYEPPLDTWTDMEQTLAAEGWPGHAAPGGIVYFCGVMADTAKDPAWFSDSHFPKDRLADVYQGMTEHLKRHLKHHWPAAAATGVLDWSRLFDPRGRAGEERLRSQYWIANIDPTERYVLSLPKTTQYRMHSDESGFDNLFLAGDWTRNTINAGCVEAAVTSGMRAAIGISNYPARIIGASDF